MDGLADPEGYLARLRDATSGVYVVVEKILQPGEELPPSWPVAGTSGYEFLNHVNQLFVDPRHDAALRGCYSRFTGLHEDYAEVAREAKLADHARRPRRRGRAADRPAGRRVRTAPPPPRLHPPRPARRAARDHRRVRRVPHLRPSRAPGDGRGPGARGSRPSARPGQRCPDLDAELFGFIGELLVLGYRGDDETSFAVRFAQVSAPVMAKGVEDTAFYRYQPLTCLNEVGGDPGRFGRPAAEFHRAMAGAAERWPEAMLTLSTHDTKRSGDVRARISVLSELPEAWEHAARRWARHNSEHKQDGWPDRDAEYLLYQTLIGAWPIDAGRAGAYMQKAAKEAKVHTSWTDPNAGYDDALAAFVAAVLDDRGVRRPTWSRSWPSTGRSSAAGSPPWPRWRCC